MRQSICIMVMVPRHLANGRVDYHLEPRTIRLPLKRGDRRELLERLEGRRSQR